jgi:hypothetical protein
MDINLAYFQSVEEALEGYIRVDSDLEAQVADLFSDDDSFDTTLDLFLADREHYIAQGDLQAW